jgi:hypothetical protein
VRPWARAVRWAIALSLSGCAARGQILGSVLDATGAPVPRAEVTLIPGGVSLFTDQTGRFAIDHLMDAERAVRITPRTDFALEVFKPGYHTQTASFRYERGAVELSAVRLVEDTLEVLPDTLRLEVGLLQRPTQAAGATYEGQ